VASRELIVLGTASQVPTRTRNHNGYLLRWYDQTVLFDPGEGTQRQLLLAGVASPAIDRICLTHLHGDHSLGLPGVLARRALDGAGPAVLHYPAAAGPDVDVLRRAGAPAGAAMAVDVPVVADGQIAAGPGWRLLARALDHRVPTVGYRFEQPGGRRMLADRLAAAGLRGPAIGRLQAEGSLLVDGRRVGLEEVSEPRPGQAVAVVMDTRVCDAALELARDADLLLIESTFLQSDADLAEAYQHLTARQAGEIAREADVRHLVLSHFSRRYGDDGGPFAAEAAEVFDGRITAARDLDVIGIPRR
jgi:ribonuclease Z